MLHNIGFYFSDKYFIPPEILGSVDNLQILSAKDNLSKNNKITDKALELLYRWVSADLFEYK